MIIFFVNWIIAIGLSSWLYYTKRLNKFKLLKWSFWATIPLIILNVVIFSPWSGPCIEGTSSCGNKLMVSAFTTGAYVYTVHSSLIIVKMFSEIYKYNLNKSQKDLESQNQPPRQRRQ